MGYRFYIEIEKIKANPPDPYSIFNPESNILFDTCCKIKLCSILYYLFHIYTGILFSQQNLQRPPVSSPAIFALKPHDLKGKIKSNNYSTKENLNCLVNGHVKPVHQDEEEKRKK